MLAKNVLTEEWLADVLQDSMEMYWTTTDGARAIMQALENGLVELPQSGGQIAMLAALPTRSNDTLQGRGEVEADRAWFDTQRRLSLSFYSPMYGDDDDQSEEWRVTQESGPINDREWDVVGRGQTVDEAISAARAALQKDTRHDG